MPTNEENRVLLYATADKPTVPSAVTCDTPLESLNLNWTERDLPERERTKHVHRLHPYLGKYIPQLVEIFLRKFFTPGQTVLDPFAGSGTTLVQANELGLHSIGYDISAFNIILCKAKTAQYDLVQARKEILDIVEKVTGATQEKISQPSLWEAAAADGASLPAEEDEYLKTWFDPQALFELLTFKKLIHSEGYRYTDLLRIILSRSARSARLTTHFDLDFPKQPQTEPYWCYKHSRTCNPTTTAYQFLRRYSLDTIKRIEAYAQIRSNARVSIFHADSRQEDIPAIDGVMTSPPYVGLIDYHEQHRYAYELLGLEDRRVEEIGAAKQGSSQKAKRAYQEGIAQVFRNCLKSMQPGGRLIVVAGDRYDLYGEIAQLCGVETEAIIRRHVNRRTGRRSSEFFEDVFIWRKP
ncbi:MAG: class I SAM-dependent methyltransferase [Chloroflexi bacterium]|nr:class I SAM-dependent methyltransferase [Chloroflexota bacterium]